MIAIVHSIYSQSVHALALNAGQWTATLGGTVPIVFDKFMHTKFV